MTEPARRPISNLLVILILLATVALAQPGPGCLEKVGAWGGYGWSESVAVAGDLAVFGGLALVVADVSEPERPRVVGEARLPAYPGAAGTECQPPNWIDPDLRRLADFAVLEDGLTVVAAARCEGLAIFDIGDPRQPMLVRLDPIPGIAVHVEAAGSLALVAVHGYAGSGFALQVYDLSRPEAPQLVTMFKGAGGPRGLAVDGDLVALVVHGTSAPGSLDRIELFELAASGDLRRLPPVFGTYDAAAIDGSLLYLLRCRCRLEIFDLGLRVLPRLVGWIEGLRALDHLSVDDGLVVAGSSLVDVSDPTAPRKLGTLTTPDGRPLFTRSVVLDGFVYLTAGETGNSGLNVFDVRDPEHPVDAGFRFHRRVLREIEALKGGLVVAGVEDQGFTVFDLSGKDAPRQFGVIPAASRRWPGPVLDLVSGSYAYTINFAQLWVFDFGDPARPRLLPVVKSWKGQGPDQFPRLAGTPPLLFLLGTERLSLLDVADPSQPRQLATPFELDAYWHRTAWRPVRVGNALLLGQATLADEDGDGFYPPPGLRVLDVSDPLHPHETSWTELDFDLGATVTDGRVAAVGGGRAVGTRQVALFNLEDPFHPRLASQLELHLSAEAIALDGGLLAACEGSPVSLGQSLVIIDVVDPAAPRVLDRVPVTRCWDLAVVGRRVALSGLDAGLEVWDASGCTLRAPTAGPPRRPAGRRGPGPGGTPVTPRG